MKLTYLGHQGWMITHQKTNILIDPLLTETFGNSPEIRFRVYPHRTIDVSRMPSISGIFITNEHLDHCHFDSLAKLPKSIPIFVGNLMPLCTKEALRKRGFTVNNVSNMSHVFIDDMKISFFLGSSETALWERRVYNLYITSKTNQANSVLIQSDTLLNELFTEKNTLDLTPEILIATNNSQITPHGNSKIHSNMLPIDEEKENGLRILYEIINSHKNSIPSLNHIVLSGSNYTIDEIDECPFYYADFKKLANVATQLSLDFFVHGLIPGEVVDFNKLEANYTEVDWIVRTTEKSSQEYHDECEDGLMGPIFKNLVDKKNLSSTIKNILVSFEDMSKIIPLSSFGKQLLNTNEYLSGMLGAERFVIHLKYDKNQHYLFCYDVSKSCFVFYKSEKTLDDIIRKFPYGISLFIHDFVAILEGHIQIWELSVANIKQWYLSSKYQSPIMFLYEYFSEHIQQDIARRVYERQD